MLNRDKRIQEKGVELENWIRKEKLLLPGEKVVISISITRERSVVVKMTGKGRRRYEPDFKRPFHESDWKKILALPWNERQFELVTQFKKNGNAAVRHGDLFRSWSEFLSFNKVFSSYNPNYRLLAISKYSGRLWPSWVEDKMRITHVEVHKVRFR